MRVVDTLVEVSGFPREQVIEDVLEGTIGRVEALEKKMAGTVPEKDMTRPPRFDVGRMEAEYRDNQILRNIYDELDSLKKGQANLQALVQRQEAVLNKFMMENIIAEAETDPLAEVKEQLQQIEEKGTTFASKANLDFWEAHTNNSLRDVETKILYMKEDLKRVTEGVSELRLKQARLYPSWIVFFLLFMVGGACLSVGYVIGLGG